jgi:hypothetical protein
MRKTFSEQFAHIATEAPWNVNWRSSIHGVLFVGFSRRGLLSDYLNQHAFATSSLTAHEIVGAISSLAAVVISANT